MYEMNIISYNSPRIEVPILGVENKKREPFKALFFVVDLPHRTAPAVRRGVHG